MQLYIQVETRRLHERKKKPRQDEQRGARGPNAGRGVSFTHENTLCSAY